jgi:hypothetical protein
MLNIFYHPISGLTIIVFPCRFRHLILEKADSNFIPLIVVKLVQKFSVLLRMATE